MRFFAALLVGLPLFGSAVRKHKRAPKEMDFDVYDKMDNFNAEKTQTSYEPNMSPWKWSKPEALVEQDYEPNMSGVQDPLDCPNYRVDFALQSMHSYIKIPTCRLIQNWRPRHPIHPVLNRCSRCAPRQVEKAEIHWNIPECTESICVWPHEPNSEEEPIGHNGGLEVHPTCAWGILRQLKEAYQYPYRVAGMSGVLSALGIQTVNPANWVRAVSALASGGMDDLAPAAAKMVDWERKLRPGCWWPRDKATILKKNPVKYDNKTRTTSVTPISAVCWNLLIDFRDLWCHYKSKFDVNDPQLCAEHLWGHV